MSAPVNAGTLGDAQSAALVGVLIKESFHSDVMRSKERLYLAADGSTIVRDGDARASTLLVAAGDEVPPKLVKRLGLTAAPTIPPEEIKGRSDKKVKNVETR